MGRYSDFDPQDLDPETGRPYAGYSSPSLDSSFHDGEMDVDDEMETEDEALAREATAIPPLDEDDEEGEFFSDDPRALQGMGLV